MMMAASRKREAPPDATAIVAAAEIRKRRTVRPAARATVEGFGCPRTEWPHHIRVVIPEVRGGDVQIIEDFGVGGHSKGKNDQVLRCVLPRHRWNVIADVARREFNERLRVLKLPVGAWKPGVNKVERMLGQELLLLACVCAVAEESDLPAIAANWATLRPEERWWFVGWLLARPSSRVLQGAALMLSGGPADATIPGAPVMKAPAPLPLFDLPITGKC
jgi:hypothetical protein